MANCRQEALSLDPHDVPLLGAALVVPVLVALVASGCATPPADERRGLPVGGPALQALRAPDAVVQNEPNPAREWLLELAQQPPPGLRLQAAVAGNALGSPWRIEVRGDGTVYGTCRDHEDPGSSATTVMRGRLDPTRIRLLLDASVDALLHRRRREVRVPGDVSQTVVLWVPQAGGDWIGCESWASAAQIRADPGLLRFWTFARVLRRRLRGVQPLEVVSLDVEDASTAEVVYEIGLLAGRYVDLPPALARARVGRLRGRDVAWRRAIQMALSVSTKPGEYELIDEAPDLARVRPVERPPGRRER